MFRVTTLVFLIIPGMSRVPSFQPGLFRKETNLTVSGQLKRRPLPGFPEGLHLWPYFPGGELQHARHAEFWMVEPEIAFADLYEDMALAEAMLKYILSYCLEQAPEEMEFFSRFIDPGLLPRLEHVINSDFGVVTYTEAIELLKKSGQSFNYPVEWGADLQTEHERYLTEQIFKKPVFVINYPKEIKAFYMRLNDDGRTVAAMDLLVPGVGEIIGGSQREERLPLLEARMKECGLL